MDGLLLLVLGSIKALVLLSFTAGITLALKRRAARVRAVVWGTAIAGCLVIPLLAPLLPTWTFPVPAALERFTSPAQPAKAKPSDTEAVSNTVCPKGYLRDSAKASGTVTSLGALSTVPAARS